MLRRYFSAMVSMIKKNPKLLNDDTAMKNILYSSGFTKADLEEEFDNAKKRALEHIEKAKQNGGQLPVVVRIFDVRTDELETEYPVDNFLKPSTDQWLRAKILFAVNNGKSVEICAPDD